MKDTSSYLETLNRIAAASRRITELVSELRAITQAINAGDRGSRIIEKNNQLQSEIARLDEQRDQLRRLLVTQNPSR